MDRRQQSENASIAVLRKLKDSLQYEEDLLAKSFTDSYGDERYNEGVYDMHDEAKKLIEAEIIKIELKIKEGD